MLYCGRHDFGSRIYSKTGNLKVVMTVMGHKDVKTAARYQHPDLDIVRAALKESSPAAKRRLASSPATCVCRVKEVVND